jgi:hypothetical protein
MSIGLRLGSQVLISRTWYKPEPRSWGEYDPNLGEYSIVAQPQELKELLDATELLSLAEEVVHLLPDDADVVVLTEMARTVAT